MTAPDRTDGDGLRASRHTEQNPDSKTWTAGIDALRQYDFQDRAWHLSAVEVHHKNEQEAIRLRDTILAALRTAPDTGERTDPCPYCKKEMHGAEDCENCGCGSPARATRFAPPKPAPDALWEALDWLINCVECEVNIPRTTTVFQLRLAKAKEALALSAPVQSGGGTIPAGFCSPGGKASCLHLHERERCSNCPVNEQIDNDARDRFEATRLCERRR
jgi:hypothetical protein